MKLRNIITSLFAAAAVLVGCQKQETLQLSEVQVDCSYVALNVGGSSATVNVTANDSWTISGAPAWLTVSPTSGAAGTTQVTFSAASTLDGRNCELALECGGKTQYINVIQGLAVISQATCKEVIAGPDGKSYKVSGVCTKISNTTYGNFYINDGTGEVYIYGTVDSKGAYNWSSFNIEVGDVVTVQGPKTTYGGTVELVDATFVSVKKSLVKVYNEDELTGPKEGGELVVKLQVTGSDLKFDVKDSWMGVKNIYNIPEDKANKVPALTAVVLSLQPNEAGLREGTVEFSSTKGKDSSKITATITQEGAIEEVMIKDFIAAPVGTAQYKISGVITRVVKADYGNVYVKDASGEVYVYGIGQKGDFAALGLKEGDIVTLVGPRAEYNGTAQMQNAQYVEHKSVTKMTAAEAMALKDDDKNDPKNYVMLTGKVAKPTAEGAKFDLEKYGNFDLVDESGAAYIYGVSTGWNGETKQFGTLGVKEGDTITLIGYKTSYNGTNEIVAFYVSHESASATEALTIDPADFPSAYSAEDSKITSGGLSLTINNVANYGDGIQMKKGGSYLYINDAIAAGIKTIKINKSATKTWYKDNIKVYAGTTSNPDTEIELKSADDNGSVYDLSGGNYTYFKIANPSNYAVYMGSIVIE